jgi:MYXO-CTERM domain-containing protein
LDIRFDGGTFAAAQNFSVGFVADATTDNSILYANLNLNAGSSEFRYRTGSFNMSDAGSTVGTSWTEPTTVSATSYLLALSVTRVGTGYTVDYSRDGNSLKNETYLTGSAWETAVAGADMTGIAFRHSQTPGVTTYLDNVSVTIVPEPTSGLLAIVSVGGLLLRRRRATSLS